MSIEEKFETKAYVKTEKILVSERRYCDVCKKEITGPYWDVRTGHHDWGNDSIESIKNLDVCSRDCLTSILTNYVLESDSQRDPRNTKYIEIQHEAHSHVKGDIKYEEA